MRYKELELYTKQKHIDNGGLALSPIYYSCHTLRRGITVLYEVTPQKIIHVKNNAFFIKKHKNGKFETNNDLSDQKNLNNNFSLLFLNLTCFVVESLIQQLEYI